MKPFEYLYLGLEPFFPPLYGMVRRILKKKTASLKHKPNILDVGGRKSHYTIGIKGDIIISDLPRKSEIQIKLNLGITDSIQGQTYKRRTNIKKIIYDNMTNSKLANNSFDIVVSVEVLEHVKEDRQFLEEVNRVLKPGGGTFIMTTPNGDYLENTNPDHIRHYKKNQLESKLKNIFILDEIYYAIKDTKYYRIGLKSWNSKKTIQTMGIMGSCLINWMESVPESIKKKSIGTCHIIALAKKGQ